LFTVSHNDPLAATRWSGVCVPCLRRVAGATAAALLAATTTGRAILDEQEASERSHVNTADERARLVRKDMDVECGHAQVRSVDG
jgi:hypothetical protein